MISYGGVSGGDEQDEPLDYFAYYDQGLVVPERQGKGRGKVMGAEGGGGEGGDGKAGGGQEGGSNEKAVTVCGDAKKTGGKQKFFSKRVVLVCGCVVVGVLFGSFLLSSALSVYVHEHIVSRLARCAECPDYLSVLLFSKECPVSTGALMSVLVSCSEELHRTWIALLPLLN